jgi:hypothetical protein
MSRPVLASIGNVDGTVRLEPDPQLTLDLQWAPDPDRRSHPQPVPGWAVRIDLVAAWHLHRRA